eukprot:symbB.v1.2.028546.t1/scaffold3031.1/size66479/3
MPVGHDGSAVSEELAQHLSRWLAKLMTEDRQRLGQLRAQQRQQRNQEAFEKWKRHKEMEARKRQPQDEEVLSRQMDRRNRPSREQCDSHYEAWCRRYDARPRPQSAPGTRPRVAEVARDQYVPVTFGGLSPSLFGSTHTKRPSSMDHEYKGKEDKLVYEHAVMPSTDDGEAEDREAAANRVTHSGSGEPSLRQDPTSR